MTGLLEELLEQQKEIIRQLEDLAADRRLSQVWYTTAQQARLKGISHAFLTQNRWARPLGGAGAKMIARRWRTNRSAVKEWLVQDDDVLLALYGSDVDRGRHRKEGIGKAVPT